MNELVRRLMLNSPPPWSFGYWLCVFFVAVGVFLFVGLLLGYMADEDNPD